MEYIIVYGIPNSGHHLIHNMLNVLGCTATFTHPYWHINTFEEKIKDKDNIKVIVPIRDWYTLGIAGLCKHKPFYDIIAGRVDIENDIHLLIEQCYHKIFDDIYKYGFEYLLFPTSVLYKDKERALKLLEKFIGKKYPENKKRDIYDADEKYATPML